MKNPSPSVIFELDIPSHFETQYNWLHCEAWLSPGIPATHWEPGEPSFVEDLRVYREDGAEVSDLVCGNHKLWEYLEVEAMNQVKGED